MSVSTLLLPGKLSSHPSPKYHIDSTLWVPSYIFSPQNIGFSTLLHNSYCPPYSMNIGLRLYSSEYPKVPWFHVSTPTTPNHTMNVSNLISIIPHILGESRWISTKCHSQYPGTMHWSCSPNRKALVKQLLGDASVWKIPTTFPTTSGFASGFCRLLLLLPSFKNNTSSYSGASVGRIEMIKHV